MRAPQPRAAYAYDTYRRARARRPTEPRWIDVAIRATGTSATSTRPTWTVDKQRQELLAVSASMRTALLVYSGITVKMMVDSDLGAQLTTMFMVQYDHAGVAGPHDHPFEETYLFLEGEAEASFDGETYRWARRRRLRRRRLHARLPQCRRRTVRWLETQAPQPPGRHSYRFVRDWDYLEGGHSDHGGYVVIVGGTSGIGRELARHYAGRGRSVVSPAATPPAPRRSPPRSAARRRASRSTWPQPDAIAAQLAEVGPVDHLVLAAIDRDANSVTDTTSTAPSHLVTLKLVGYTEVVHALRRPADRRGLDPALRWHGAGPALPGSTTVVDQRRGRRHGPHPGDRAGADPGQLHPPGIVGDSPYWAGKPAVDSTSSRPYAHRAAGHDGRRRRRRRVPAGEPAVNGVDLPVDGGWR